MVTLPWPSWSAAIMRLKVERNCTGPSSVAADFRAFVSA